MAKTSIPKASWRYDYSLCVELEGGSIVFRDILGADLEFLDCFLERPENKEIEPDPLNYEDIVALLQYLVSNNVRVGKLWAKDIMKLWQLVSENILCRYMSKRAFLKLVGVLQNGRFIGLLEDIPIAKIILMADVYQEIVAEQSQDT